MREVKGRPECVNLWPAAELFSSNGGRAALLWWARGEEAPRLNTYGDGIFSPPTALELCEMHKALREVMKDEQEVPSVSDT